ncbi:SixA phosphatase family protein [Serinibacter arcticus]|uniref:SixA phosphatase family protein n=1 Tax=Serinibacter arcticus TaxID=1655435 RepID=UPI001E4C79A8|nr:histidine phosphatase family protein [Serinibacter arcticus]
MTSPRTLVLMRHAKAEGHASADELRVLAPSGRRQATAAGAAMAADGLRFDAALVSSAVRTRQTWELVAERLSGAPTAEVRDDLYDATARTALEVLRHVEDGVATLLVVGHEPVMSSLALLLAGPGSEHLHEVRAGVPTATRCILAVPSSWADLAPRSAVLTAVVRTAADS